MKIVSVIPARGGSKGIKNKNIQDINGQPLIAYNIQASINSCVDETYVSTDSRDIADIAQHNGVSVLMRPSNISDDNSSSEDVLLHFAENVDFDILVFLQCTSPLTTSKDINNSVDILLLKNYDSVLSVCNNHGGWLCGGFTWEITPNGEVKSDYDINNRPRRQDMNLKYRENGAIYVMHRSTLIQNKCRLGGNIGLYVMNRQNSFEIDENEDLQEVRKYLCEK